MDGLLAGGVIGLPPVLDVGSPELQAKIVPDVLAGRKFICLAISEAFAGSDVGGMQTYAYKDGNEWVISGTKKCVFLFYCGKPCSLLMRERTDGSQMARSRTTSLLAARRMADTLSSLFPARMRFPPSRSRLRILLPQAQRL